MARAAIEASAGGTAVLTSSAIGGVKLHTAPVMAASESPSNARCPVSNS
ncbi:hypothetical protein X551_02699 [Methylibium sp. T29]|nr:hypothetical protein X551_02699 [Methylibium sp. T29]EWS57403.1 hypothetical protein Y694_04591 [Methylibium sp. T29-B]